MLLHLLQRMINDLRISVVAAVPAALLMRRHARRYSRRRRLNQ